MVVPIPVRLPAIITIVPKINLLIMYKLNNSKPNRCPLGMQLIYNRVTIKCLPQIHKAVRCNMLPIQLIRGPQYQHSSSNTTIHNSNNNMSCKKMSVKLYISRRCNNMCSNNNRAAEVVVVIITINETISHLLRHLWQILWEEEVVLWAKIHHTGLSRGHGGEDAMMITRA